jgi:endoglucanase
MRLAPILAGLGLALPALAQQLPLSTESRWIIDATGQRVKLRCINWAGHMETHIPEGLDKQSIDTITGFISQQGFNCVRLTYSIDHALNPDLSVQDAFTAAAAPSGLSVDVLSGLYTNVAAKNSFVSTATTQNVFEAVVASLWKHNIMTVLDNHVSRASWCCKST